MKGQMREAWLDRMGTVLVSLLWPSLQELCCNNIRMILHLHSYHDAYGSFVRPNGMTTGPRESVYIDCVTFSN